MTARRAFEWAFITGYAVLPGLVLAAPALAVGIRRRWLTWLDAAVRAATILIPYLAWLASEAVIWRPKSIANLGEYLHLSVAAAVLIWLRVFLARGDRRRGFLADVLLVALLLAAGIASYLCVPPWPETSYG